MTDDRDMCSLLLYEEKSRQIPKMGKIAVDGARKGSKILFLSPLKGQSSKLCCSVKPKLGGARISKLEFVTLLCVDQRVRISKNGNIYLHVDTSRKCRQGFREEDY